MQRIRGDNVSVFARIQIKNPRDRIMQLNNPLTLGSLESNTNISHDCRHTVDIYDWQSSYGRYKGISVKMQKVGRSRYISDETEEEDD